MIWLTVYLLSKEIRATFRERPFLRRKELFRTDQDSAYSIACSIVITRPLSQAVVDADSASAARTTAVLGTCLFCSGGGAAAGSPRLCTVVLLSRSVPADGAIQARYSSAEIARTLTLNSQAAFRLSISRGHAARSGSASIFLKRFCQVL